MVHISHVENAMGKKKRTSIVGHITPIDAFFFFILFFQVLLRDSYIAFCDDIAASSPTAVLMLDNSFTMHATKPNLLGNYHLILTNQTRRIQLKGNKRELDEWSAQIKKVQDGSPWIRQHRFDSFAPVRRHAKVKWFVDAESKGDPMNTGKQAFWEQRGLQENNQISFFSHF